MICNESSSSAFTSQQLSNFDAVSELSVAADLGYVSTSFCWEVMENIGHYGSNVLENKLC